MPTGAPNLILFLLVPVEILSYVSRIFSLSIRLFANMMSGHTLLVILITFLYAGLSLNVFIALPFIVIHLIFFMEIGVALLQVYVFITLSSLYLNDVNNPHSH